jgi:hypothetical protein
MTQSSKYETEGSHGAFALIAVDRAALPLLKELSTILVEGASLIRIEQEAYCRRNYTVMSDNPAPAQGSGRGQSGGRGRTSGGRTPIGGRALVDTASGRGAGRGRGEGRGRGGEGGRGGRSAPSPVHQSSGVPFGHVPAYLPGSASLVEELDQRLLIVLRDGKHLIGVSFAHSFVGL